MTKISEVQIGWVLDLEGDPYAITCDGEDEDCNHALTWEMEYGIVEEIDHETPTCTVLTFENGEAVGFPTDHDVNVVAWRIEDV